MKAIELAVTPQDSPTLGIYQVLHVRLRALADAVTDDLCLYALTGTKP